MVRLAALMPADETQLLYSICLHGRGELGLAPDEYAALTMVLLRLLAFKPVTGKLPSAEKKTLNNTVALVARPVVALPEVFQAAILAVAQSPIPAKVQPWEDEQNQPLAPVEPTQVAINNICLLYTSPSPRDRTRSRMPSSA